MKETTDEDGLVIINQAKRQLAHAMAARAAIKEAAQVLVIGTLAMTNLPS